MDFLIPQHTRQYHTDLDPDAVHNADLALMKAYTILKRESCSRCGMPYWIGHNSDNYIQFNIEESTCYSCQSLNDHNKKQKESDSSVNAYPVLEMLLEKERPSRASWLRSMVDADE